MKNYIHKKTLAIGLLASALFVGAVVPATITKNVDAATVCEQQIHNQTGKADTFGNPNMMRIGNTVKATFDIPNTAECKAQIARNGSIKITLASYCAPSLDGRPYSAQKYHSSTSKVITNVYGGRHTMYVSIPAVDFYQVDLVRGDALQNFQTTTYYQQGRLLHSRHGGTRPCGSGDAKPAPVAPAPVKPVVPVVTNVVNTCSNINSPNGQACNTTNTTTNTVVNEPKPEPTPEVKTVTKVVKVVEEKEVPAAPGKPAELPNTGAGNIVATFFGVTSLSSMLYYAVARRFGA